MFGKLLKLLKSIKCKINCCYESQCSMNIDNEKVETTINYKTTIV